MLLVNFNWIFSVLKFYKHTFLWFYTHSKTQYQLSHLFQMWDSNNGTILVNFHYEAGNENILCINLSQDSQRLIASVTNGLVLVIKTSRNLKATLLIFLN